MAALLCAVAGLGCGPARPKPVDFSEAAHSYRPADYPGVYQNWTHHAKLVLDIGTAIEAWATYKSWDFRQAYVAEYAGVYSLPEHDRDALLQAQLEASRSAYEFHVEVQTTNDKWNDLDRRSSPWRVALLDGAGNELSPSTIRQVRLPELYEETFFPLRTEFTRGYEMSFPRSGAPSFGGQGNASLALRIASPVGQIVMTWESAARAAER